MVIPAYNEAAHLPALLSVLCPDCYEVIVVDDGSTDETPKVVSQFPGVISIRLPSNRGKSEALATGVRSASQPVIIMLDADLIGFNALHLALLADPILADKLDVTIGVFRGGRLHTDLAHRAAPFLSGQRGVKASLITQFPFHEFSGFEVDVGMLKWLKKQGARVGFIPLHGITHIVKEEKRGFVAGVSWRLKMYWDVVRGALRKI